MKQIGVIRKHYPRPSPFPSSPTYGRLTGQYCVAGAFILARHHFRSASHSSFSMRFPSVTPLAKELQRENPNLSNDRALDYANQIVDLNDARQFVKSWKLLSEALRLGSERTLPRETPSM